MGVTTPPQQVLSSQPHPRKSEKPIFLLGVGCQKGGTTWLHTELEKCPFVDMGFAKEYHILDELYISGYSRKLPNRLERLKTRVNAGRLLDQADSRDLLQLLIFHMDPSSYYDYFQGLCARNPEIRVTGDITPSYVGLSADSLKTIKQQIEARGFDVKVVFIMRDPFERLWSMVRHNRRNRLARKPGISFNKTEAEMLSEKAEEDHLDYRGDYPATIQSLEEAFPRADILYTFYEDLFTAETSSQIASFLDIPFSPDLHTRVNATPKAVGEPPEDVIRKVVRRYQTVYTHCKEHFPEQDLEKLWRGYSYL